MASRVKDLLVQQGLSRVLGESKKGDSSGSKSDGKKPEKVSVEDREEMMKAAVSTVLYHVSREETSTGSWAMRRSLISLETLDSGGRGDKTRWGVMKVTKEALVVVKGNIFRLSGSTGVGGAAATTDRKADGKQGLISLETLDSGGYGHKTWWGVNSGGCGHKTRWGVMKVTKGVLVLVKGSKKLSGSTVVGGVATTTRREAGRVMLGHMRDGRMEEHGKQWLLKKRVKFEPGSGLVSVSKS